MFWLEGGSVENVNKTGNYERKADLIFINNTIFVCLHLYCKPNRPNNITARKNFGNSEAT